MEISDKLSKWIAIVTGIIAMVAAYESCKTNSALDDYKKKDSILKYAKDSSDFTRDREFKFKIYDLVTTAISKKEDSLKQKAAFIVVSELVSDKDESFKLGLLNVIKIASTPSIRKEANLEIFKVEEAQKNNLIQSESVNRVDIFYLESTQVSSKSTSEQLSSLLGAKFNVRVRLLPSSINAKSGYGITNKNEIRFEENEREMATEIQSIIKSSIPSFRIEERRTTNVTKNYISLFIVN